MSSENLSTLHQIEYIVLGILSKGTQSRYGLRTALRCRPDIFQNALNHLEVCRYLTSTTEHGHWYYRITAEGEQVLDGWLRTPPTHIEMLKQRSILMSKFLFAENRLTADELFSWLDQYEMQMKVAEQLVECWSSVMIQACSIHQQLLLESSQMELEMQRNWLQRVRARLSQSVPMIAS